MAKLDQDLFLHLWIICEASAMSFDILQSTLLLSMFNIWNTKPPEGRPKLQTHKTRIFGFHIMSGVHIFFGVGGSRRGREID